MLRFFFHPPSFRCVHSVALEQALKMVQIVADACVWIFVTEHYSREDTYKMCQQMEEVFQKLLGVLAETILRIAIEFDILPTCASLFRHDVKRP